MIHCKSIDCTNSIEDTEDFCPTCAATQNFSITLNPTTYLSDKYPQYYKDVGDISEIDIYAIHRLFNLHDASGCLHDASKKLLMSGTETDNRILYKSMTEARDTLSRWLELNPLD